MEKESNPESARNAIEKDEEVLMVLRRSRKAFLIEYSCGFLLLILLGATYLKGIQLPLFISYPIMGIGITSLAIAEISRIFLRYIITNEKISIVRGFLKQTKKNINYHPLAFVPDISMKQNRIQRVLNYGTVSVESGTSSFEIREVDNPERVMGLLENMIEKTRTKR